MGIVIIGATGGIGQAVTKRLEASGNTCHLVSRNESKLSEMSNSKNQQYIGDVLDESFISETIEQINTYNQQTGQQLDGLIFCVGSILLKPLHQTRPEELLKTWQLNALAPALWLKAVIKPMMTNNNGSVVFCSSVAAQTGLANHEAIAMAKGSLNGLVRSAAMTYAGYNIRINAIAPGLVDTPLASPLTRSELALKASVAMHPLGRIGEADQVAQMIEAVYHNSWMTGQIIGLDGGMSSGRK
jgi:NAD(P)-dependent dehydrogenase (short-subunit alcohol dehydrogenase family)